MTNRLALVIGAQCQALPPLPFVPAVVQSVHEALTTGRAAGWAPATADGSPLLDAPYADIHAAIRAAFRRAHETEAALAIWLVGHGVATGQDDYYFMARDSPQIPRSSDAVHLVQVIREELDASPRIDGLVLVVDSCDGGELARGLGSRLIAKLIPSGGRLHMITASADAPAYGGCLSRTFAEMDAPSRSNPVVTAQDVVEAARNHCTMQTPLLLTFDGRIGPEPEADPSLWLKRSRRYVPDAATGTAGEALLAWSRAAATTSPVSEILARATQRVLDLGDQEVVWVVGAPGAGKSALLSSLYRTGVNSAAREPDKYLHALVSLPQHPSIDSVLDDIDTQVRDSRAAARDRGPTEPPSQIRVGLDGFDALTAPAQHRLRTAIEQRIRHGERFVIGSRQSLPPEWSDAPWAAEVQLVGDHLRMQAAAYELINSAPMFQTGDALTALLAFTSDEPVRQTLLNMLGKTLEHLEVSDPQKLPVRAVITIAQAADSYRPLPLSLGQQALRRLAIEVDRRELHEALFQLQGVITRLPTPAGGEAIGLADPSLQDVLNSLFPPPADITDVHSALADELRAFRQTLRHGGAQQDYQVLDDWQRYAQALSYHLIHGGRFDEARRLSWETTDRTKGTRRRPMD